MPQNFIRLKRLISPSLHSRFTPCQVAIIPRDNAPRIRELRDMMQLLSPTPLLTHVYGPPSVSSSLGDWLLRLVHYSLVNIFINHGCSHLCLAFWWWSENRKKTCLLREAAFDIQLDIVPSPCLPPYVSSPSPPSTHQTLLCLQVVSDGKDLPGVILSLSGGTYRSNNLTNRDGQFSFLGLVGFVYYMQLSIIGGRMRGVW